MSTAPPRRDSLGIFLPGPVSEAHQAGTGGHMLPACCHGWKLRPAQPGPFGKSWAAGQKLQRGEREKKKSTCVRIGRGATQRSSPQQQPASQQAPGPSLGRLLFPPPPSPHRFDSISCSRVWLVSQGLRHHYLRALLLPPPPPSCSPSCFIFIFHLPSAVSPLVLLQHLLPRQGTCESKRPFSIPSLRPRSASSSSPR